MSAIGVSASISVNLSCTPNLALVRELAMLAAIETEYLFLFTDSEADGNVDHLE